MTTRPAVCQSLICLTLVAAGCGHGPLPRAGGVSGQPEVVQDARDELDASAMDMPGAVETAALPADVSEGAIVVHASHATLIPPPLSVDVSATDGGVDVTKDCAWTAVPNDVCQLLGKYAVRKVGDGTCVVTCSLPNGKWGAKALVAKKQSVIYGFGGIVLAEYYYLARRVTRFRVADNDWDDNVTTLPFPDAGMAPANFWIGATAIDAGGSILLVGGEQKVWPDYGDTPYPADYCPGVDPVTADKQNGCGLIWRFDLASGEWSAVGKLAKNRYNALSVNLGDHAYIVGGISPLDPGGVPAPFALRVSLPDGKVTPLSAKPPASGTWLASLVPWKGGALGLQNGQPGTTFWIKPDDTFELVDLGVPKATVYFSVPGVSADLYEQESGDPASVPCAVPRVPGDVGPVSFRRLEAGVWSKPLAGTCLHGAWEFVRGPDAEYILSAEGWGDGSVRRLAPPGDTWQELGKTADPTPRLTGAVVVVEQ